MECKEEVFDRKDSSKRYRDRMRSSNINILLSLLVIIEY